MCQRGNFGYCVIKGRKVQIDQCLVPIIDALNEAGILTAECCCGHGEEEGHILAYQDGEPRLFVIYEIGKTSLDKYQERYRRLSELSEEKTRHGK